MIPNPAEDPRETPGVRAWRGSEIESTHAIHAARTDASGRLLASHGDPRVRAFLRSSVKPIQVVPLIERGLVERFGLGGPEIAVMIASHNGEPFHIAAVRSILEKTGIEEDALQCGPHEPLGPAAAQALRESGEAPSRLHNNCSGKHAAMLAVCRAEGWPEATYRAFDHPLQRRIREIIADLAGLDGADVGLGVDGCGAPTFAMPVRAMARMFAAASVADERRENDLERAIGRAFDAMAAHPEYVAGTDRLCTSVLRAHGDRLIVKTGAEGVFCVAERGTGRGIALKVADGARRAQDTAIAALLVALELLSEEDDAIRPFLPLELRNRADEVVGHVDAALAIERSS